MKLLIIYNTHAGHKRSGKIRSAIQSALTQKELSADILVTERRWHGMDLVEQADLSIYQGVIANGGDGTLFEVINGYFRNPGDNKPPIGLIPTGTGNAFARDLGLLGFEWRKALNLIANKQKRSVDVARFKTGGKDFYYLNILGLGFVADVSATAHHLKRFGDSAYILGVFYQTALLNSFTLTIEIDNQKLVRENIFVEVSNTRYTGSNFLMAPNAEIDDGLLDVVLLNKVTRRRLLKLFPTIFKGTHIFEDEVESFKARKIRIETNRPKILTPDGELMGSSPVEIECLHRAIDVFG